MYPVYAHMYDACGTRQPLTVENWTPLDRPSPTPPDKLSLPIRPGRTGRTGTVQRCSTTLHIRDATEATNPFDAPFWTLARCITIRASLSLDGMLVLAPGLQTDYCLIWALSQRVRERRVSDKRRGVNQSHIAMAPFCVYAADPSRADARRNVTSGVGGRTRLTSHEFSSVMLVSPFFFIPSSNQDLGRGIAAPQNVMHQHTASGPNVSFPIRLQAVHFCPLFLTRRARRRQVSSRISNM
ncbi:hypothetical protein F4821DRAFT_231781 [Hypoxylon rubiginosum]|uniref:Uncharacterized protein n=1 Tax=Hypoxylon rubiginosum TaxID=110542 RepID=A0ACC0D9B8_9PEZI|nr:hypothetical protein F4821DRAFT_231781 [Hypoxylon rubiginosum]